MFNIHSSTVDTSRLGHPMQASHSVLLNQAINLFEHARWKSFLENIKSTLLQRSSFLLDLECIPQNCVRNRYHGGLKPVNLVQICGTLGRTSDFDHHFHPLSDRIRDRWVSIAMARSQNIPLEPVELIQVGDCYFVKDGHHRISVAHARGELAVDADIIIWSVSCSLSLGNDSQPIPLRKLREPRFL